MLEWLVRLLNVSLMWGLYQWTYVAHVYCSYTNGSVTNENVATRKILVR